MSRTVRTREPSRALRKPSIRKPGVKIDASFNSKAFKTHSNRPSVTNVMGNEFQG